MKRTIRSFAFIAVLSLSLFAEAWADSPGRALEFLIEDNGATQQQIALIQDGKISVKQIGGNTTQDILFDAQTHTLFLIDHLNKSYYKIDQNVINKVASMIDSLSAVAESQQGVLSDLMQTLGMNTEEDEVEVKVLDTKKILSAANINCKLFQEFRNGKLASEMCIAPRENLGTLGVHYTTLNSFYEFGDQLLNRAGSILENMGMAIPTLTKIQDDGLPILIYIIRGKVKTSLTGIREQDTSRDYFLLPSGYIQTPIPFIG